MLTFPPKSRDSTVTLESTCCRSRLPNETVSSACTKSQIGVKFKVFSLAKFLFSLKYFQWERTIRNLVQFVNSVPMQLSIQDVSLLLSILIWKPCTFNH